MYDRFFVWFSTKVFILIAGLAPEAKNCEAHKRLGMFRIRGGGGRIKREVIQTLIHSPTGYSSFFSAFLS